MHNSETVIDQAVRERFVLEKTALNVAQLVAILASDIRTVHNKATTVVPLIGGAANLHQRLWAYK